jgi:hypothetical protein
MSIVRNGKRSGTGEQHENTSTSEKVVTMKDFKK